MNKSSTLKGLLNEQPKNIAEYLATWDDLNVFWKSLNQAWNLIAGLWSTKNELEQEDKEAYIKTVNVYMKEKNIPIDYAFYISNQIMNPVKQVLDLEKPEEETKLLFNEFIKVSRGILREGGQHDLFAEEGS